MNYLEISLDFSPGISSGTPREYSNGGLLRLLKYQLRNFSRDSFSIFHVFLPEIPSGTSPGPSSWIPSKIISEITASISSLSLPGNLALILPWFPLGIHPEILSGVFSETSFLPRFMNWYFPGFLQEFIPGIDFSHIYFRDFEVFNPQNSSLVHGLASRDSFWIFPGIRSGIFSGIVSGIPPGFSRGFFLFSLFLLYLITCQSTLIKKLKSYGLIILGIADFIKKKTKTPSLGKTSASRECH